MRRDMALLALGIVLAFRIAAANDLSSTLFYERFSYVPEEKRDEWQAILEKDNELARLKALREGALLHIQRGIAYVHVREKDASFADVHTQWNVLSHDKDPEVRLSLARELNYVWGAEPISILLVLAKDREKEVRDAAYRVLARKQQQGYFPSSESLKHLYRSDDPDSRSMALRMMRTHPFPGLFKEVVLEALEDSDRYVRGAALDFAYAHDLPLNLLEPIVRSLYASISPDKRKTALEWALNSRSPVANEILLDALRTSEDIKTLSLIIQHELPGAMDVLIERTDSKSGDVQHLAYKLVAGAAWLTEDTRRTFFEKGITDENCGVRMQAFVLIGGAGFYDETEANSFVRSVFACWEPPGYDFITEAARIADKKTVELLMAQLDETPLDDTFCEAIGKSGNLLFIAPLFRQLREIIDWIDATEEKTEDASGTAENSVYRNMTDTQRNEYEARSVMRRRYVSAIANILKKHPEMEIHDDALLEYGLQAYMRITGKGVLQAPQTSRHSLACPDGTTSYTLYQPGWLHVVCKHECSSAEYLMLLEDGRWGLLGTGNIPIDCQ